MTVPVSHRPLRRDAARNRAQILETAGELFADRGLGVSLNDIAHHAGVGVGTVYRHFPDKDRLIETLLETRVDEMVATGEACLADPDPWRGLVCSLEHSLELQATNRGLRELIQDTPAGLERVSRVRDRLLPIGTELLARAQAAGAVRPDLSPADLPLIQLMLGSVIEAGRNVDPTLWRRYLGLLLRGLATHPEDLPPLPDTGLGPDSVDRVLTAGAPLRTS
jgi:AcrR family transcriptional regulator